MAMWSTTGRWPLVPEPCEERMPHTRRFATQDSMGEGRELMGRMGEGRELVGRMGEGRELVGPQQRTTTMGSHGH